jgi:hypothetical protein
MEAPRLAPEFDEESPEELRPTEIVPNMLFSRKKVADFMDKMIERRQKYSAYIQENFVQFLLQHVPEGVDNENGVFVANIWAGIRRYSAEPDFLAYSLLLRGMISYTAVRDNKEICKELTHIFSNDFESEEKMKTISKQKLFYGLQEVLPNKPKEMWQDLMNMLPPGGPDTIVNYEWLLQDDLYVLSPIVYALRLQHMEECLQLTEKLSGLASKNAKGSPKVVTFAAIEEAFSEDEELQAIQDQDMQKILSDAFHTHVLEADTEQELDKFIETLMRGDIFRKLYFPELPPEDEDEQ